MTVFARPEDMQPQTPKQASWSAFPRVPLFGALGLVAFVFAAVIFGQTTEIGTVRNEIGKPVDMRDILLAERSDGAIMVVDATTRAAITRLEPGQGGFAAGALPALKRIRLVEEAPQDLPYRVIRWDSGAVSVSDTATGERIYLNAFGSDIVAQFVGFLDRGVQDNTGEK
ncbi:photosynthetic complex assembly protein PuhC [Stappia sp. ES.058]|uniref:photosynthetic complex assembly protein PuhC n=1 Tax=Stappia sp. ES.058 TaxID=1881061 RepID=UPI00087CD80C|nr:photosynthetic complex assembly protein PuhC [Stappia sp. ES.058]SDT96226.1 putative photosynthetic complex assembly protein [Stappia sp. ES.058]